MFHETLQLVHHTQRMKTMSLNNNQKLGHSTHTVHKMGSTVNFGSSVAIHKLRESKWFSHSESKILCSVVESGFILEKRQKSDHSKLEWGIACWDSGYEKSKNMDHVNVYTAVYEKDKFKVIVLGLKEYWADGTNVRINNNDDKETAPNHDLDIHKQIQCAMKNKNMKWHNSHHFVHWCRYTKPSIKRTEQMTDRVKWSNVSVTAGMLMFRNKFRRTTTSQ